MKKRSRLSIFAGLSAAAGVKVSLLEALDRIEAEARAGGNLAQANYPTETRRRRAASARRRVGHISGCWQHLQTASALSIEVQVPSGRSNDRAQARNDLHGQNHTAVSADIRLTFHGAPVLASERSQFSWRSHPS